MENDNMQELDEEYRHWLITRQIGNPVAVVGDSEIGKYRIATIECVERLTRTIKVKGMNDIFKDGDNGESILGRDHYILMPVTDEIIILVYRDEVITRLKNCNFNELSTSDLYDVEKLLNCLTNGRW
jgi:hypothetical protein